MRKCCNAEVACVNEVVEDTADSADESQPMFPPGTLGNEPPAAIFKYSKSSTPSRKSSQRMLLTILLDVNWKKKIVA